MTDDDLDDLDDDLDEDDLDDDEDLDESDDDDDDDPLDLTTMTPEALGEYRDALLDLLEQVDARLADDGRRRVMRLVRSRQPS